ncbi:MAG: FHA domain-containing protein [Propionicimonas sp.]
MAKPHKYAWNGIDAETTLTIEQLANMAQRAAMESTGDLMHGKHRIASAGSTDRQIEFRVTDFLISFKKLMLFHLDFEQRGERTWLTSRIDWYVTTQQTVAGFIPVSTKSMVAHHTYLQFVRNLAEQIRAADPQARLTIREGVVPNAASPAVPSPTISSPAGSSLAVVAEPVVERAERPLPPPPPAGLSRPLPPPPPPPGLPARAATRLPTPPVAAVPGGSPTPGVPAVSPVPIAPVPPVPGPSASPGRLVTGVPGMPRRDAPVPEPEPVHGGFATLADQLFADDEDLEATRIAQRGPDQLPWFFELPDGTTVRLAATVVVGRNPVAPATTPAAEPVLLDDPQRSVSKTHALLELRDGLPWVTDLHSSNGTTLTNDVGEAVMCEPGIPMPVGDGWRIGFGEYVISATRKA